MAEDERRALAQADAAEIVRLAFAQAERVTSTADEARAAAERELAAARAEAARLLDDARREREELLADARRDRVAAEEALLRARSEAEREASAAMARASELARREAEILLDGGRTELLRARDEAAAIRAAAERDAEAILASATQRARSTSAELLAATRRRIGTAGAAGAANGGPPAPPGNGTVPHEPVVDLSDDRPPGERSPAAALPVGVMATSGVAPLPESGERRYRGGLDREPWPEDVDRLVHDAVRRALERTFAPRRRRHRR